MKAKGFLNIISTGPAGVDPVWLAFQSQVAEFAEAEIIKARQNCSVGRQYPASCSKGLCSPEHVRSRKERCTLCNKIK